ncbi:type II toxin-antitoxin system Phd/YefM family antitoxin [Sodalis sp. RH24]|uniref:type II toxin-antitoxin system Phd/YefM family antitoxin n=1 Tax=unclassified Sodalis (in: enterobacteria) TaxID=2636512 RepID=UPI003965BE51
MSVTYISSRELNQNITKAKRDAVKGPVFIKSRNKITHVLLSEEAYRSITGGRKSILDALSPPDGESFDLETERAHIQARPVEF